MNSELAKKLMDAGFPFDWTEWSEESVHRNDPTLSELIEACGSKFDRLWKEEILVLKWYATGNVMPGFIGEGSTPDEAVANLWLAFNNKT